MHQNRGILYIPNPLRAGKVPQEPKNTTQMTLVFNENERYLYQAQAALWELRKRCGWICVCAEGAAAGAAVSLAAQLPVDRLALKDFRLFVPQEKRLPRELARLRTFARQNLSLVVSQVLIAGAPEAEVRRFVRALNSREVCVSDGWSGEMFVAPWEQLMEKNLLIPVKCV